jgi:hypothetical protein
MNQIQPKEGQMCGQRAKIGKQSGRCYRSDKSIPRIVNVFLLEKERIRVDF